MGDFADANLSLSEGDTKMQELYDMAHPLANFSARGATELMLAGQLDRDLATWNVGAEAMDRTCTAIGS
jgi:hypothetical protein